MPELCELCLPKNGQPVFNKNKQLWLIGENSSFAKSLLVFLQKSGYRADLVAFDNLSEIPENLAAAIVLASSKQPPLALLRRIIPILQKNGAEDGALLVGLARLDGAFGFAGLTNLDLAPQAAIIGIVKSLSYELPEVTCRAIDLDNNWQDEAACQAVCQALVRDLPMEVGLTAQGAKQLVLTKIDQEGIDEFVPAADDVIVISGGARGVTAHIARQFAAPGVKLVLLGRSPMPAPLPSWAAGMSTIDQFKKGVLANSTEKLTPKSLEQQARQMAGAAEILATIAACRQRGAVADYRAVDVRDSGAVAHQIIEISAKYGPVTMLVHGAGVLSDAYFVNKKDEDYQKVYGTKVEGFNNLLKTCGDSLRRIVLFSSTTARLGRKGQSDYAAANEVLNKTAQAYARIHKNCTVKAMGWGPWAGGMVNSGLAKLFADEGIGLIGLEDGARLLARELKIAGPVEVAILGAGSLLPAELFVPVEPQAEPVDEYLDLENFVISLKNQPVLSAHKLAGNYVVPFALVMEWFLQAASCLDNKRVVAAINNVQMLNGLKVGADGELPVQIRAKKMAADSYLLELVTDRKGVMLPAYRAEVLMAPELETVGKETVQVGDTHKVTGKLPDIYKKYLFHGKELQAFSEKPAIGATGAKVRTHGSKPQKWLKNGQKSWIADPLLLDVAFQLAIVWSTIKENQPCLPARCASFVQYASDISLEEVTVAMQLVKKNGATLTFDIEWSAGGQLLASMKGYEAVMNSSLVQAFRENK